MKSKSAITAIAAAALLGGCAGWDGYWNDLCGTPQVYTHQAIPLEEMPAFPRHCLPGDTEVMAYSQCPVGEAACYQLDTGNWCTGISMAQCPGGSIPIAVDVQCPVAGSCWMHSSGLRCHSV
ncbi:hypothetical protein [Microbulbifer sp.]|uniref:hypothetical protein n=1 Tax=Microbulbifer sp. TaxID=1908541 RepID=UPI003F3C5E76